MERWCATHHIRELMDEFVVGFLRSEAASMPVKSHSTLREMPAAATTTAVVEVPPAVPQVYGELYQRSAGQAYAHHAGELLQGSSSQLTITALRAFLKSKLDSKGMWRSMHPYIVLLVEGGEAGRVPHEAPTTSSLLAPHQQPAEPSLAPVSFSPKAQWTQEAAFTAIVTAVAQSVARGVGGLMYSATPALLPAPDDALHPPHRPLEQGQQQEILQQIARVLASKTGAPAGGAVPSAGGDAGADAAQCIPGVPHAPQAAPQMPVVFLAECWPYTIADGLALEGLLGSPVGVFCVSMDETDKAENKITDNNSSDGVVHPNEGPSALFKSASRRGSSAHAALLEYYAAKRKLITLTVPTSVCSALAQEAQPLDFERDPSAGAVVQSLAEQIVCHFH
ncbi:hypothetical protein JKF63_04447 [Porcisia hertigi]|uniref:Uncharacterized protein n=1 Tax=Porcisia hertigi TaxID=2761500 RepID=A0A836IVJ9_9TRYP|nr:hypothetical protein JKF63_04447 [Porcisia hertigi]